jgi:hypothetical protein
MASARGHCREGCLEAFVPAAGFAETNYKCIREKGKSSDVSESVAASQRMEGITSGSAQLSAPYASFQRLLKREHLRSVGFPI